MKIPRFVLMLLAAVSVTQWVPAEERTFPVGPGGNLSINMGTGGSIEVKGSADSQVRVNWDITGPDADNLRVTAEATGNQVRISTDRRRGGGATVKLWVSVPNRFDLDVRTMGGNMTIGTIEGKIVGETMGGNLTLTGLKGELKISTKGGNISLADSDIDGKASTMGGNITIRSVAGNMDVSTMGGNVILDNLVQRGGHSINKVVEVSTMGGNIDVANAPRGAKVDTQGGNIVIKKSGELIDARTMGGNIAVNEHSGRINAHTMGGNVSAVIIPGGADQSIDIGSMGGRIELTLPAEYSGAFDLELAYTRKTSGKYQIISDFPIQKSETPEWDSGHGDAKKYITGTGTVGSGANKVKVRTVNGDIVIRKR
jgi:DUF4097 and DUF4098 domain-containing protein YvlB